MTSPTLMSLYFSMPMPHPVALGHFLHRILKPLQEDRTPPWITMPSRTRRTWALR